MKKKYEALLKTFDAFINQVIKYINSYYHDDSEFYEKLSYFSAQSFKFLTWKNVIEVADIVNIDNLDKNKLYSEFYDIKSFYDYLKLKSITLNDQIKSYISSKRVDCCVSNFSNENFAHEDSDSDGEETISLSNQKHEDLIRSDELWAYILNTTPNATPNLKKTDFSYFFYSLFKFICRIYLQQYETLLERLSEPHEH